MAIAVSRSGSAKGSSGIMAAGQRKQTSGRKVESGGLDMTAIPGCPWQSARQDSAPHARLDLL